MKTNCMNRGLTWVEVLVMLVIAFFALGLLLPSIGGPREAARRTNCMNKVRQIGLGLQSYESSNRVFPPSASVTNDGPGKPATVGGWSFLVRILPFMDYDQLYKTLSADGNPEDFSITATAAAMNTVIQEFVCPTNGNRLQRDPNAIPPTGAFTNYKGMGASTKNSLMMALDPSLSPPYGTASQHPDGMMFPGKGTRRDEIPDGLSRTIATIETIDDACSRWTVGREVTLVGLPQRSSPTVSTPQPPLNYFVPPGFDHTWGRDSAVAKAGLRTFLAYDFSPTGADAGKYEDPGFSKTPPAYGPSSAHPAVVICGFGDGSVQAISKQIDAANLFFLITKNNSDPFFAP